jgi:hypothetical protein
VKIARLPLFAALTAASLLGGSEIASAHPAAQAPTAAQITARLRHTIEIGTKGEYFRALGHPIKTIKDGRGTGTLTAVVGTRWPTADGKGQVVFFWHNRTFIGQSASYETTAVGKITSPAPGTFLKPLKVTYAWSGHILISNGVPPKMGPNPVRVKYQP